MDRNKLAEISSTRLTWERRDTHAWTKPFGWKSSDLGAAYFHEWAIMLHIISRLGLANGSRILDLGCGTGWTSVFLARTGFRVHGIDLSPDGIEIAKERAEIEGVANSVTFEAADMEHLPNFQHSFDLVVIYDSLHHCARDAAVLQGAVAALAPQGWLVLSGPA